MDKSRGIQSRVVQVWSRHLFLVGTSGAFSGQRRSALGHLQSPKRLIQVRTTSFLWYRDCATFVDFTTTISMPEGGEVQSVIEQEGAVTVSVSYDDDLSAIADHFQGWIDDNSLEVINRFESSDPQSITWSVEDEDRGYNITLATAGDTIQVTIMTGRVRSRFRVKPAGSRRTRPTTHRGPQGPPPVPKERR